MYIVIIKIDYLKYKYNNIIKNNSIIHQMIF